MHGRLRRVGSSRKWCERHVKFRYLWSPHMASAARICPSRSRASQVLAVWSSAALQRPFSALPARTPPQWVSAQSRAWSAEPSHLNPLQAAKFGAGPLRFIDCQNAVLNDAELFSAEPGVFFSASVELLKHCAARDDRLHGEPSCDHALRPDARWLRPAARATRGISPLCLRPDRIRWLVANTQRRKSGRAKPIAAGHSTFLAIQRHPARRVAPALTAGSPAALCRCALCALHAPGVSPQPSRRRRASRGSFVIQTVHVDLVEYW